MPTADPSSRQPAPPPSPLQALKIIYWPDPRLIRISKPVERFDAALAALANRMFELMREHKGVGLAAPQVGKNLRLFVMNPTADPAHDRVYVNPVLSDADGDEEAEEGCLSLPKININVFRSLTLRIRAQDLEGNAFEQVETGYVARIWQHETDHLNGILLLDRMGPAARITYRKLLKDLKDQYDADHPPAPPRPAAVHAKPARKSAKRKSRS
jgi:peptide deformylase